MLCKNVDLVQSLKVRIVQFGLFVTFLYFGMKLPKESTDGLPKEGFH